MHGMHGSIAVNRYMLQNLWCTVEMDSPEVLSCVLLPDQAFDNTRGGLLLAALLAVGAPLGEMFIVNVLHW